MFERREMDEMTHDTTASRIIRARACENFKTASDYAKAAGFSRAAYYRRIAHPGEITVEELNRMAKAGHFSNDDLLRIVRGYRTVFG